MLLLVATPLQPGEPAGEKGNPSQDKAQSSAASHYDHLFFFLYTVPYFGAALFPRRFVRISNKAADVLYTPKETEKGLPGLSRVTPSRGSSNADQSSIISRPAKVSQAWNAREVGLSSGP